MKGPRVLIVDDEPQIQRFLRTALRASDYDVIEAASAREALKLIVGSAPDAVLLDLGLPDMDGMDLIREVRAWSKVPIIVLSARDRELDKVAALDLGADDYVEKPFGIGELLARLRAALRHKALGSGEESRVEIGGLVIDMLNRLVTLDAVEVRLTPKEYELLALLARHPGRVVTHRQLLAGVWGPAHVDDTQYLRVFIGQLRAKIEADPAAPRILKTEPGVGYRLLRSD